MLLFTILLIFGTAFTAASSEAESKSVERDEPINEDLKNIWNNFTGMFYETDSSKFYASRVSKNWNDAEKSCKDAGMVLASITSQNEQMALIKFMFVNDLVPVDDESGYWLSGRQIESGLYNWNTVDKQISCWGWLPNEPNNEFVEKCVELKLLAQWVRLGWNTLKCDENRRFICQSLPNRDKDNLVDQIENHSKEKGIQDTMCYKLYWVRRMPRLG